MTTAADAFDIAICGAGPIGLALAALLVRRGVAPARICLLDGRTIDNASRDPRSIALSYGSRQILEQVGAWPLVASSIEQIHVSRRGHFGRTLIEASEYGLPALGYVARYGDLVERLAATCTVAGIVSLRPATVAVLTEDAQQVRLRLGDGRVVEAGIVVQAEGGLFGEQTLRSHSRDYGQVAIVAQVTAGAPLMQRAFERFTDEGPLALLPQGDDGAGMPVTTPATNYALVWCMRPATAMQMLALADSDFLARLEHAFGGRLGRFTRVTARSSFTLGLNAEPAATARTVAIGNAAQTLHPVAGQGLNLGLRDATVLARLLGEDTSPAMLRRFVAQRQADRRTTIGLTDLMARIFAAAPGSPLQGLLGLSLGLVDAVGPAKRLLAEQMMFGQR